VIASILPRTAGLPPGQRRLLPQLRPSVALGFVLYGGTAISLYLGHRQSFDFDFFHDAPLDKRAIRDAFAFMPKAQTLQDARNTLVVSVPGRELGSRNPVKVSFFGDLSFGRVADPTLTADGTLQLASLDDLMAHKLKVILQRAEKKDYQDIAAMIRAGGSLARGLAAARLFFGNAFQPAVGLKALVYFGDSDLAGLSRADRHTLIEAAGTVESLPSVRLRSRHLAVPLASTKARGSSTR